MTLQAGLRPIQEDAPDVSRAGRSVPIQDPGIRAPALVPQAQALGTFARAAQPAQDDNAQRLAAALSGLNPSLQRFAGVLAEDNKGDVESSVQAKILKAGSTQAVEKLIASDPEMASGLGKAAASRRLGQLLAADAINAAKTRYQNDFDRVNGNVGQLTADVMKPYLDKYGHDPIFRKQFVDDVTPGVARITSADAETKAQDAYARTQDDQAKIFTGIVAKSLDAGKSPEEAAKAVIGEFYGNEKILRLPYAEQQKALVPVVRALAEQGRYDVVKALGETEFRGERLLDNGTVGPSVAAAMTHARTVRDRETRDATVAGRQDDYSKFTNGEATPADEERLLKRAQAKDGYIEEGTANAWVQANRNARERAQEQARKDAEKAQLLDKLNGQEAALSSMGVEAMKEGRLFSLPQVTVLNGKGTEETLTPEKFRERAAADFEKWSTQHAQQKGETWDQTVLREAPVFTANGHVPAKWRDLLTAGGNSISAAATTGGDLPEAARQGYALYKLLRANNVQMLGSLVPKEQRDFYEAWRVGEEETGLDARKALGIANEYHADPAARLKRASSPTAQAIREKVANLGSSFGSLFGGQPAPENIGDMAATVGRYADFYGALGLGADAAVKAAVRRLQETHVSVNGYWCDVSDRRVPPDFPTLAGEVLAQYAAKHGKAEGLDARDLTVRNAGAAGDVWRIVRKSDGVPVDDQRDGLFRVADLLQAKAAQKDKTDAATLKQMKTNATSAPLYFEGRGPSVP